LQHTRIRYVIVHPVQLDPPLLWVFRSMLGTAARRRWESEFLRSRRRRRAASILERPHPVRFPTTDDESRARGILFRKARPRPTGRSLAVIDLQHRRQIECRETPFQPRLVGSCKLVKLPSQVRLSSYTEESSIDFDHVSSPKAASHWNSASRPQPAGVVGGVGNGITSVVTFVNCRLGKLQLISVHIRE